MERVDVLTKLKTNPCKFRQSDKILFNNSFLASPPQFPRHSESPLPHLPYLYKIEEGILGREGRVEGAEER